MAKHTTAVARRASQQVANQEIGVIAARIDEIAAGAVDLFKAGGSFEQELALAQGMKEMRAMLTPEIMAPVMELMNTDLGFRTDRDPALINRRTGKPNEPYSVEDVREVFIEARLRGFHLVGNEFNIIAKRFYAAKNGFRRKVTGWVGVTDFRDTYSVPRMMNGGAIVKASATWKLLGVPDSLEREFAIRVNEGMGADAITGKAERKLLKAIHDRLAGVNTPDGEVGDEPAIPVEAVAESPAPAPPAAVEDPTDEPPMGTPPAPATKTKQQELADIVVGIGCSFDRFRLWGEETGNLPEELGSFDDIPDTVADRLLRSQKGLIAQLKAWQA